MLLFKFPIELLSYLQLLALMLFLNWAESLNFSLQRANLPIQRNFLLSIFIQFLLSSFYLTLQIYALIQELSSSLLVKDRWFPSHFGLINHLCDFIESWVELLKDLSAAGLEAGEWLKSARNNFLKGRGNTWDYCWVQSPRSPQAQQFFNSTFPCLWLPHHNLEV